MRDRGRSVLLLRDIVLPYVVRSTYRGHGIFLYNGLWLYEDTWVPVTTHPNRKCGFCLKANTPEKHDGCLGTLPGIRNACCGHGDIAGAYVQFSDNWVLRGEAAVNIFNVHKRGWKGE